MISFLCWMQPLSLKQKSEHFYVCTNIYTHNYKHIYYKFSHFCSREKVTWSILWQKDCTSLISRALALLHLLNLWHAIKTRVWAHAHDNSRQLIKNALTASSLSDKFKIRLLNTVTYRFELHLIRFIFKTWFLAAKFK